MKISRLRKITSAILAVLLLIVGIAPIVIPDSGVVADTAASAAAPEAVINPNLWAECQKNAGDIEYVAIQNNIASASDRFEKQSDLTVKREDYYTKDRNFYIHTLQWHDNKIDLSAMGEKGYIKFWVKTPKAIAFQGVLVETNWGLNVKFFMETTDSKDWQEVIVRRDDMTGFTDSVDITKLRGIRAIPGDSADAFLSVGETISFGPIEIYDEELPKDSADENGPEVKRDPSIWLECKDTSIVSAKNNLPSTNPAFPRESELSVNSADYYTKNKSFYIAIDWNAGIDFSAIGEKGYLSLWVKTPHAVSFNVILLHTTSYLYKVNTPVTTTDSTAWQEIKIPVRDMGITDKDFDFKNLIGIRITPAAEAENFLAAGEKMSFGQIGIYDEELPDESTGTKPEFKKAANIWRDNKYSAYSSYSNSVKVTDNDNFKVASNLTVLNDGYYTSANDKSFYIMVDWGAGIDLSMIGDKGYFKFWIKTPRAVRFKVEVLHTANYYRSATFNISTSASEDWQEIIVARSDMSIGNPDFDFSNLIGLKVIPLDADSFLAPGEAITFGQIEIYDEEIPKQEGAPDFKSDPTAWRDEKYSEYFKTGTSAVEDNDNFTTQSYATILKEEYYSKDRSFYIMVDWNGGIDLSAIGDKGYMTLWVKTPHPATFTAQILYKNYQVAASFEITTAEGSGWQEFKIPRSKMSIADPAFDFKELVGIKILPAASSDKFLKPNETIYFGQIEVYSKSLDGSEEETEFIDLGEISPKKNHSVIFDAQVRNASCSSNGISVGTFRANTSLFEHSMKATLNDSEVFFANASNMTFYTTWGKDINVADALANGYLELWIKTPHSITMDLVLSSYWPSANVKFTTQDTTDWQKITIPVGSFIDGYESMSYNNMILIQLRAISATNFIKNGESFEVGRITFFCPNDDIGSSGADKEYPIKEDTLTKYEGTNFKLTNSTYSFWAGDYGGTEAERTMNNEYGAIAKDDINYHRFKNTMRIWLTDVEGFYAKNKPSCMVYIKKSYEENGRAININLDDYLLTGTLRVWLKVDKKITLKIGLRNGQAHFDAGIWLPVTVEPTTENNGFVEVQIPLKDFYDKAVKENISFRFDKLDGLSLAPMNNTKEGYLDEGESLIYSTFEIWAKEAPVPEVIDTTKVFTCGNGNGIILIDKNEIMPETTVINAFHNGLEDKKMKYLLSDWSKKASLVDAFCLQTISDNKTDARLTSPYDMVQFSVPLSYIYKSGKITPSNIGALNAVFYSDGIYTNAKLTVQDENLLIDTTASGDLIFFSGTPGKDGPGFSALNKDDELLDLNNPVEDEDGDEDGKKTTYKKVIRRKKKNSLNTKLIWLIACIIGAILILILGFLGYKKFIASSLSLLLIMGMAAVTPIDAFALEDEEKKVEIRLVSDHPGIPGYDVKYETIVYYGSEGDMERLDANEFTLSSTLKAIEIKGSSFVLPSSVKDNTELDGYKIYVSVKKDKNVEAFYPLMIKKWSLKLEDNFEGDKLNEDIWALYPTSAGQMPQDNGKYCQAYVSNDCVSVENGNLVMRILDGKDGTAYSKGEIIEADFLMPRINTKGKFEQQYGCFMSSMKMPYNTTAGSNSAFWLLPSTGNWGNTFLFDSPAVLEGFSCGEIDIIEYSPAWKNGKFQSAMHWWESTTLVKGTGMEKGTSYPKFTRGEYVNMACVWNENSLYIYYDGILQRQVKNLVASGEKAYIIYTMQTAGYGDTPSWTGAFTEADLPQMVCYVDYMKVFS